MPRLLPVTILFMGSLLVMKSGHLIFPATAETGAPRAVPVKAANEGPGIATKPAPMIPADETKPTASSGVAPLASTSPSEPSISDSERALLLDLRQRRITLDSREATIAAREVTFQAVEKRLTSRFEELTALQHKLEDLERQRLERDEGSWRGLVKLYEAMKPRDAAAICNDLDPAVLIPVLGRMKEGKAAAVLSAMLPDRARLVTVQLASERKKANAAPAADSVERIKAAQPGG